MFKRKISFPLRIMILFEKLERRHLFMLNQKVVALLNDQVNKEFFSAYLYLDFSNFYEDKGLEGFYRLQNNIVQAVSFGF